MNAKTNRGRPVHVQFKDSAGQVTEAKGTFQVWGYQIKKGGPADANLMNSKAIVELNDGSCIWVNPTFVKFLDRQ